MMSLASKSLLGGVVLFCEREVWAERRFWGTGGPETQFGPGRGVDSVDSGPESHTPNVNANGIRQTIWDLRRGLTHEKVALGLTKPILHPPEYPVRRVTQT